jgi:hypothetical protein
MAGARRIGQPTIRRSFVCLAYSEKALNPLVSAGFLPQQRSYSTGLPLKRDERRREGYTMSFRSVIVHAVLSVLAFVVSSAGASNTIRAAKIGPPSLTVTVHKPASTEELNRWKTAAARGDAKAENTLAWAALGLRCPRRYTFQDYVAQWRRCPQTKRALT